MRVRARTVGVLAKAAGLDVDEALSELWDAGFDEVKSDADLIPASRVRKAMKALGISTDKGLRSISAYARRYGVSEDEIRRRLEANGISLAHGARNFPKGVAAKAKRILGEPTSVTGPRKVNESGKAAPLSWKIVGRERDIRYLSSEDVNRIHWHLVNEFRLSDDPIDPPGIRDLSLFEAAVARPRTGTEEYLKYPTAEMAAAALMHSLVQNHPFHNGNKRTALVAMCVLLGENQLTLTATETDALKLVLRVARHSLVKSTSGDRADQETQAIAEWIHKNERTLERGDLRIQFRVLRQILNRLGCEFQKPKKGNRIDILRKIEERRLLRRRREVTLKVQVAYRNEGTEVEKNTISLIRRELRLTEEDGCDSAAFYGTSPLIDHAIASYNTTLRKLARL